MKKTKLKKRLLTTMWPAMYSWATISHFNWVAKAGSCLQAAGKRRQTVMLMARKQEDVGTMGIIGAGPGRSSRKIQAAHCRLLKTFADIYQIIMLNQLPNKCEDSAADCEGPGEGVEGKDGANVEPSAGKGEGGQGHQTRHHCPAFEHAHPPSVRTVKLYKFCQYTTSPSIRVCEGIFHRP